MSRTPPDSSSPQDKTEYQAQLLKNRLAKRLQHLGKWARRSGIGCYRLYDRDIPEIPLAIDLFHLEEPGEGDAGQARTDTKDGDERTYLRLYLYQRPYEKEQDLEAAWLDAMARTAAQVVGIDASRVMAKTRMRQRGLEQYEREETRDTITGVVGEQGHKFLVNLSSYLDTGLFMDHRPLRKLVESQAGGKAVLNLFCYTASFSVYAAAGGARRVDSVDLSNTYLAWGKRNFFLNGLTDRERYRFIRSDVSEFLRETRDTWDLVVLDPPTFSNSKKTKDALDINRDWPKLVNACLMHLNPGGILYFSTNSRQLKFIPDLLAPPRPDAVVQTQDITAATIPEDFRNQKIHRCWKITI